MANAHSLRRLKALNAGWLSRIGLICALYAISQILAAQAALAQAAFDVPERMEFAGIDIRLNADARSIIRQHGTTLVKNNKYYRSMTERADAYFPVIERVLREENVPEDFKYLAIQESGLTSDVTSSSKAVGYWQFKAETATDLGLRCDPDVDERMNIVASTRGAARYLKNNNKYLDNWVHALLSYYAGLGGARSIINPEMAGSKRMDLDGSTHFYILKFLAHKIAFEQVVNRSPNPNLQVMEYGECEGKTLRQIASETNVPIDQVEFYNKWCRNGVVPQDRDYTVVIPVKAGDRPAWASMTTRPTPTLGENLKPWVEKSFFGLIKKEVPQPQGDVAQGTPVFFSWNGVKAIMARKEDNIIRLALAANITREEMMDYNDLRIFDLIVPGQVYYVKPKRKKAKVPFHTVRPGETLWEVAQNYGITLDAILRKNRMHSVEKLKPGRILWMRHIRPEDHPVEFDANVPQTPILPVSSPILAKRDQQRDQQQDVLASASTTSVVTSSTYRTPTGRYDGVTEKYEDVKTTESEQITIPAFVPETDEEGLERPASTLADKPATTAAAVSTPASAPAEKPYRAPGSGPTQKGSAIHREPAPVTTEATPTGTTTVAVTTVATKPAVAPPPVTPAPWRRGFKSHIVEQGQTLFAVSRLYAVRADSLKAWNPEAEAGLKAGMYLYYKDMKYVTPNPPGMKVVTAKTETTQPAIARQAGANEYEVQPGDTFYGVARKNNLTVPKLQELNGKTDLILKTGEILKVK